MNIHDTSGKIVTECEDPIRQQLQFIQHPLPV